MDADYFKHGFFKPSSAVAASIADLTPTPWVRPADWLAMPTVLDTEEKIVGLVAVPQYGNAVVAFLSSVAYTVNWGDGTVENFAANIKAEHKYDYNSASLVGSECSRGYRQAIVTITPQTGGFGSINFHQRPTTVYASPTTFCPAPWLDLQVNSLTCNVLTIGSTASTVMFSQVERVNINVPACTSAPGLFYYFNQLRRVDRLVVGACTDRSYTFFGCVSLEEISVPINLQGAITVSNILQNCTSLKKTPVFQNTESVVTWTSAFYNCSLMRNAPSLNMSNATGAGNMFLGCVNLRTVPAYNTPKLLTVSAMFQNCSLLTELPLMDFSSVTDMNSFAMNCRALRKLPAFNTIKVTNFSNVCNTCDNLEEFPSWNFAAATNFSQAFYGCMSLTAVPALSLPVLLSLSQAFNACKSLSSVGTLTTGTALNNLSQTFSGCSELREGPVITNTQNVWNWSQMFSGCPRLEKVPTYNTVAGTDLSLMFFNCWSLIEVPAMNLAAVASSSGLSSFIGTATFLSRFAATGMKATFSVGGTRLNAAGLNEIFANLATVAGQTITITGCPGAVAGSGIDRTIATAKGWTVTG